MSNIKQHRISQTPRWPWICASFVVVSGVGYLLYNTHVKRQARAVRAQNVEKIRESVDGLVKKYDAVEVPKERPGDFSANYAEMLIRADHRPVVFLGSVQDVGKNGDHYVLLLDSYEPRSLDLQFSLIADRGKAQQIMQRRKEAKWAIVASVSSVSPQPDWGGRTWMLAEGTCVDLVSLDAPVVMNYVFGDSDRE